jgi:uncharacterized coiled-coil DUF342 family protein
MENPELQNLKAELADIRAELAETNELLRQIILGQLVIFRQRHYSQAYDTSITEFFGKRDEIKRRTRGRV